MQYKSALASPKDPPHIETMTEKGYKMIAGNMAHTDNMEARLYRKIDEYILRYYHINYTKQWGWNAVFPIDQKENPPCLPTEWGKESL